MCIIAKVCFCFIHGQSLIPSTIACWKLQSWAMHCHRRYLESICNKNVKVFIESGLWIKLATNND